eukprot:scaffold991_cov128-Cylindrotheca_fusiformis.AAC.27
MARNQLFRNVARVFDVLLQPLLQGSQSCRTDAQSAVLVHHHKMRCLSVCRKAASKLLRTMGVNVQTVDEDCILCPGNPPAYSKMSAALLFQQPYR